MNVIVTPSASGTLTVRSASPVVTVTPVAMSLSSASTPGAFYDSKTLTTSAASTWTEYDISWPLESAVTLENQSTGTLTLTGNRVGKATSGIGFVNARTGTTAKSIECDVRETGGQSFSVFDGYETGTVSKEIFDAIDALLIPEKSTAYFTAQNHTTASYPRNADCWLAGIDLSFIAVGSNSGSGWTRHGSPILIAPQIVAMCEHFTRQVGAEVRFADASGAVVATKTIIGLATAHATTGDAMIGILDSPVSGITPCKVVGEWIEQDPETALNSTRTSYIGGGGFWMDQTGNVYAYTLGKSSLSYGKSASGTYNGGTLTNVPTELSIDHSVSAYGTGLTSFAKIPVTGDSGSFVGVIVNGEPALFLTWHYPSSGTPFFGGDRLTRMIESAKTNAGISGSITMPTVATDPTL